VINEGKIFPWTALRVMSMAAICPLWKPLSPAICSTLMKWADELRTVEGSHQRRHPQGLCTASSCEFGAEGIGLCRTEHMFFEADRIAPCAR
jgi:pyruvate,orthophosphate dikinase